MELPRALKKSPMELASARGAAISAQMVRAKKTFLITLLIDRRREVWRRSRSGSTLCGKTVKSSERKKVDPMPRAAIESKVRCDFADDWRELEAVPGKAAAENHVCMMWIAIDHEIAIRRETVHAGLSFAENGRCSRHPRIGGPGYGLDIASRIDIAIEFVGRHYISKAMKGEFYAHAEIGETIKGCGQSGAIEQKGREPWRLVCVGCRRKPDLDVTLDLKHYAKLT